MKRFFKVLTMALVAALAISCYDDAKVWEKLDSLEAKLTELTSQVNSVSSIVSALEGKVYVKAVTEVTGGYEIEFTDGKKVTVKDGKDGADAPEIGATKDVDGIYYWTLGGEWLLDAAGNKVPAGIGQPKLKTENGQWYISVDGKEWALIGPDVACTIKDVAVADDAVTFTLADGTEIVIPLVQVIDITFDIPEESVYGAETVEFAYVITGGTEKNRVAALCTSGVASVVATDANSGVIKLSSLTGTDFECTVFVTDGVERTIFKTLKFRSGVFTTEEDEIYISFDAATVTIPVATTMEYVVTPECDWITVQEETKAEVRNEEVVLNVTANQSMAARSAYVSFVPKDEAAADMAFKVAVFQDGHAKMAWTKIPTKDFTGYTAGGPVRLAQYGDYLLVSNLNKIFAINPADGSVVNTFNLPEGYVCNSLCVDEGGNIIIANDARFSWAGTDQCETLYVYVIKSLESQPELLIKYSTANIWGDTTGNIHVAGNVDEKALIVAAASGAAYWVSWTAENGAVATDENGWSVFKANTTAYSFTSANYGVVVPAGNELSDGLWFVGYGGDYSIQFCANPAENAWAKVADTGNNGNFNLSALAVADMAGRSYVAAFVGAHFSYADPYIKVYDVTDITAAQTIYTFDLGTIAERNADWSLVNWTGVGAYSDVIAVSTESGINLYYIDANFNMVGCVTIR